LTNAARYLSSAPGSIEFRLLGETIPAFRDEEVDIIYCISVLEHIPDFESTVVELSRILKKGGLLLLTIDLDLRGGSELGVSAFKRLKDKLSILFDPLWPEVTIHPVDILFSNNGPYSAKGTKGINLVKRMLIHNIIKLLLGRKPNPFFPNYLAVHGVALEKR
jgi:SAM-dependent methyltransferase